MRDIFPCGRIAAKNKNTPPRQGGAAQRQTGATGKPREAKLPPGCTAALPRVWSVHEAGFRAGKEAFSGRMRTAGRSSGSWALKRAPDRPSHSHWNSGRWPGRWPTRRRSRTGLITRFPFHSDRLNTCRSVLYKKVRKANRSGPAAGRENSQPSRSSSVSRVMYTGRCLVSR